MVYFLVTRNVLSDVRKLVVWIPNDIFLVICNNFLGLDLTAISVLFFVSKWNMSRSYPSSVYNDEFICIYRKCNTFHCHAAGSKTQVLWNTGVLCLIISANTRWKIANNEGKSIHEAMSTIHNSWIRRKILAHDPLCMRLSDELIPGYPKLFRAAITLYS